MSIPWDMPADDVLGDLMSRLAPDVLLSQGREHLAQLQGAEDDAWRGARVMEALYHPGRYVRVAYALLHDESVPDRRLWPQADVVYVHAPVREPVSRRGTTLTLGDHRVEAYRFPNDRRLRGLRKFTGSTSATRAWQSWLDQAGDPFQIDARTLQRLLLRYVPEQKWVVRLRAEGRVGGSGETLKRRIAVRCTPTAVCEALAARHAVLAQASDGAAFRVPAVVGADTDQGILAVEWNRGESLIEILGTQPAAEVFADMAAMLRAFHATEVTGLETLMPSGMANHARDAVADLAIACPDLADRLTAIDTELTERLATLDAVAPVTLHNDLHWNQVRIKRGVFTILDLERVALGDPLVDVANLTTQLRMLGDRPEIDVEPDLARRWANEFLAQWVYSSSEPIDARRFRCYATCTVLSLARGMMRHLRPNWRALARRCVEVAESDLAAVVSGAIG